MNRREFAALAAAGILLPGKPIPGLKPKYRKQLLDDLDKAVKASLENKEMDMFQFLCAIHRAVRRGKEAEVFDLITLWAWGDAQKEGRGE